jgi:hypothetical protein
MIDDEAHVGMAVDQRSARVDVAREEDIDREVVSDRCAQDAVEARVIRRALRFRVDIVLVSRRIDLDDAHTSNSTYFPALL